MASTPHLLMVSFDAVGDQDVDLLLSLPHFSALCSRGTLVREVSSVFVSNTYPSHTTIQTGVLPRSHGIIDNDFQNPAARTEKWRFHVKNIRAATLSDKAFLAGKSVCTVLYPVTGGSSGIAYNFVEIAGQFPAWKRIGYTVRYGSAGFVLYSLLRFGHFLLSRNPAALDMFTTAVACSAIERKKPDLTMVHLLQADSQKHKFGPAGPESAEAMHQLDNRLGELLLSLQKAGRADSTSVIVFSDHSCCSVHTSIMPNDLLKDSGLSFADAFFHSSGGCCFLKIYNPQKSSEVSVFIHQFLLTPGVERLLTDQEMYVSGADLEFEYGFAASIGYCFGPFLPGQHGYTLDRDNYHTFYLAAGSKIPANEVRTGGSLLNLCPLAADILELDPWPMEGENLIF